MPTQVSMQLTDAQQRQIEALTAAGFGNRSDVVRIAVDRMYREEIRAMNTKLILQGEFSGEMAPAEAVEERSKYIVNHLGTAHSTAEVNRLLDSAENTGAVWSWHDGSHTVVDIRPK